MNATEDRIRDLEQRLAASEAGAAALRTALDELQDHHCAARHEDEEHSRLMTRVNAALASDAGAALLARVERLEKAAQGVVERYDLGPPGDAWRLIPEIGTLRAALSGADAGRSPDVVLVNETWRMPSKPCANDGLHTVSISAEDAERIGETFVQSVCADAVRAGAEEEPPTTHAESAETILQRQRAESAERERDDLAAQLAEAKREIQSREEHRKLLADERDAYQQGMGLQQKRAEEAEAALAERTRELEEEQARAERARLDALNAKALEREHSALLEVCRKARAEAERERDNARTNADLISRLLTGEEIAHAETRTALDAERAKGVEGSKALAAIADARMHVNPNACTGEPTLWCDECQRDSGMHWDTCTRVARNHQHALDDLRAKLAAAEKALTDISEETGTLYARIADMALAQIRSTT